ncbi:MAG: hypothetical protein MJ173_09150, partial [Clostridia bacterium]|nr:hypothetical protein [Clostridia bacterium]
MKTFKKALSLLLCAVMVFGTVAVAGTAIVTKTFAATTSAIKSKSDLETQFSSDPSVKPYIYMGIDYYESDGKLTD